MKENIYSLWHIEDDPINEKWNYNESWNTVGRFEVFF